MTRTTTGSSLDHAIGPEGLVSIGLPDGEVRIRAVDGDTVRIRDRSGRDLGAMFTIDLAEGSAALTAIRDGDFLGRRRNGHAADLDIDAPRRATVLIETASAEIESDGLVGEQRYRTTSGDVTLRNVAGRIDIEAVSGDVDVIAAGRCRRAVPDRVRRHRASGRDPAVAGRGIDQRGPEGRGAAGRSGPVRDRDRQRRRAARPGRRSPDRDDDDVG